MLVTILPFFLAARVFVPGQRSSDWYPNGPECTYDVLVNMASGDTEKDVTCSTFASELKCRTMGNDTLRCRFVNERSGFPVLHNNRCSMTQNFIPVDSNFSNADLFDIKFNTKGIENVITSGNIPEFRLDVIRLIVGRLNVGFELDSSSNRFVIMENSSVGHCETEVKISRVEPKYKVYDFEVNFELERAGLVPLSRAALVIEKVRDPKYCLATKPFESRKNEILDSEDMNLLAYMVTSKSRMIVSSNEFHSHTEWSGMVKINTAKNRTKKIGIHQTVSLTLKTVSQAPDSMQEIENPVPLELHQ